MAAAKKSKQGKIVAFIGAGKMATAIASGLAKHGNGIQARAFDVSAEAGAAFEKTTGFPFAAEVGAALDGAEIAILAVKPQFAAEALKNAAPYLKGKLIISIVAGWTIEAVSAHAKTDRVIRVMPNTPALVGEGMSCFAPGPGASEEDAAAANEILSCFGRVRRVLEKQLDAVTGLSGSGPAYVMEFILGLADGGVYCGLPRTTAVELAVQTVLGTARMCLESGASISDLRDAVISPAGTTACGILALQQAGFKGTAARAVIAGAEKSEQLGKK